MKSSNLFAKAFENLRTGVLLLDRLTGRVMEANPAFLRLCGRRRGEIVGHNLWAPPLVDDADAGAEVFEHLRTGGQVEGVELPFKTGDGSRLLMELSARDLSGAVVQLEVRDATVRAGAQTAERAEARRSLAARVAVEFAETQRVLEAGSSRKSDEFRKAADRAGAIARDLIAYCGHSALESGPVQLNEVIEAMQPALQQMLGRNTLLVSDLSRDIAPVMADAAQVRRILLKLAANAGEAMPNGGKFRIGTRNAPADDPVLRRSGDAGPYAMLEVADDGPGFDDPSWEHLFEPFFTTKPQGKQGLGLAAVYGMVRQMGGRLWADSEPGKGASFHIYLPHARVESAAVPAKRSQRRAPATILLMEQNDGLRTVMQNILKKRGYRVLAAHAANEALELAKTQGPPDLLISEPAPDLVERVASLQPRLRTLYLNGHSDHAGVATLRKPFELETFLGKVRESLATN